MYSIDGSNGSRIVAHVPLPDTSVGKIQYKAKLGTTNGAFPFTYPAAKPANYYELSIPYRAPFGSGIMALLMFAFIATMVWGGLGFTLRAMFDEEGGGLDYQKIKATLSKRRMSDGRRWL